jgi:hypothetical protein
LAVSSWPRVSTARSTARISGAVIWPIDRVSVSADREGLLLAGERAGERRSFDPFVGTNRNRLPPSLIFWTFSAGLIARSRASESSERQRNEKSPIKSGFSEADGNVEKDYWCARGSRKTQLST